MSIYTHRVVNGVKVDLTPEEIVELKSQHQEGLNNIIQRKFVDVRMQRDNLLKQSDLLVFPDLWASYTTEKQTAISNYRKALRDIPQTQTDPENIVWPTLPN
jgi:hypothetical protein